MNDIYDDLIETIEQISETDCDAVKFDLIADALRMVAERLK